MRSCHKSSHTPVATTNNDEDQLQQQINRQRVLRQITLQANPQPPRPQRIIRQQPCGT